MKKVLMFLAVALAAFALTSCGGSTELTAKVTWDDSSYYEGNTTLWKVGVYSNSTYGSGAVEGGAATNVTEGTAVDLTFTIEWPDTYDWYYAYLFVDKDADGLVTDSGEYYDSYDATNEFWGDYESFSVGSSSILEAADTNVVTLEGDY